ncbi:hypothetical protein [Halalkalicoccus subterraneus]|uniref:hypothetical protein n=1 Tax=Halalkalicoccus subterraneus TaxID=2675002 RepID=UPI0013CEB591|nr:hypothetical protein [Halalkalicoccus subterraneus]
MSSNRRLLTLVVLGLCVSLVAVGGVAPTDVAAQNATTNETGADAPHTNPDEASEDGDSERVANWLQQRLGSSLGESSVQLSEGQYDQARETLGDDYNGYLTQYAEMVGEDNATEFEQAQTNQTELINATEEYNQTYTEYQDAQAAGDDERARELARDLNDLSEDVEENSQAVQQRQQTIEEETGTDTSDTRATVEDVSSNVATTQQEVRNTEFVVTELTVETDSRTASFGDPMTIDGTITTTAGQPVANEPIVLEINEQTIETTTDSTGSFSVEYRPTTESLDLTELEIGYTPQAQSEYAEAETSVPVRIEQTQSSIDITNATESVAYGEEFTVTGTVEAATVGIEGVPVAVFADGNRIGETTTDENGSFESTTTLPADIRADDIEVRASTALNEQALASAETTTVATVSETQSELEVAANHTDDSIYVQGALSTNDGTPIAGEVVTLDFAGQSTTIETAGDGSFETLVDVPETAGAFVTVEATYAEDDSNLGESTASTDVQVGEVTLLTQLSEVLGIGWLDTSLSGLETQHWLTFAGSVLLGLTGAYFLLGRRGETTDSPDLSGDDATNTGASSQQDAATLRATLLSSARDLAQSGDPNRAVERAYVAIRQDDSDESRTATHWEFYQSHQDGFAAEQIDALRSLTQRFEQAAFSALGVSSDDADAAVDEAETIIDE